jgi:hypothetical protein
MRSIDKRQFRDYICRPFCIFFGEGQKEAMACQGAQVVQRLVSQGRVNREALSRHQKRARIWKKRDHTLDASLCQHCSYRVKDCDFTSPSPRADCEPCGGYIIVSLLKENGVITSQDLEEVALE